MAFVKGQKEPNYCSDVDQLAFSKDMSEWAYNTPWIERESVGLAKVLLKNRELKLPTCYDHCTQDTPNSELSWVTLLVAKRELFFFPCGFEDVG